MVLGSRDASPASPQIPHGLLLAHVSSNVLGIFEKTNGGVHYDDVSRSRVRRNGESITISKEFQKAHEGFNRGFAEAHHFQDDERKGREKRKDPNGGEPIQSSTIVLNLRKELKHGQQKKQQQQQKHQNEQKEYKDGKQQKLFFQKPHENLFKISDDFIQSPTININDAIQSASSELKSSIQIALQKFNKFDRHSGVGKSRENVGKNEENVMLANLGFKTLKYLLKMNLVKNVDSVRAFIDRLHSEKKRTRLMGILRAKQHN